MIKIPFRNSPVLKESESNVISYRVRTDMKTRALIDKAIELQSVAGTAIAAGFLKQRSISIRIIERVLMVPKKRRKV